MVKRITAFIHREVTGVHNAAIIIAGFTFLSQIFGLIRERMLAHYYGASIDLDMYYGAFRIPDILYASIGTLVSVAVLIPFFTESETKGKEASKRLLDQILTLFAFAAIVSGAVLFFLMPHIADKLFPGFTDPAVRAEIIRFSQILLIQPIFLGLSNLLGVITQSHKRFFLYTIAPVLYNVAIIGAIIFLRPYMGIEGVVYGVVIGGLLHMAIQIPYVQSRGLLPHFTKRIDISLVKRILLHSIPRTLSLSAIQLELVVITAMASLIGVGSITIFTMAYNLQSVPLTIVGLSYAVAAFPLLASYYTNGKKEEFLSHLVTAARHIIFWSIPITILFIVLRAQIVRVILGSGSFNWENTRLVAACLALFSVSIVAQSINLLLTRAYYAAGKTLRPFLINVCSAVFVIGIPYVLLMVFKTNETFRYFVESLLRVKDIAGTEVLMLPLGFSVGSTIATILLMVTFETEFRGFMGSLGKITWKSFSSGIIGGFVAYISLNVLDNYLSLDTFGGVLTQGFISGVVGIIVIALLLKIQKVPEYSEIMSALKQKITKKLTKKTDIVGEPEKLNM